MALYLIDINFTKNGVHDCFIHSFDREGIDVKVNKRCSLPVGTVSLPGGEKPFDCMDDVNVRLTPEAEAVVADLLA